ncbi:MAG: cation transporter [Thermodesulfovibrionales bacterium]|nr:cation transporter [Thermodesulfovibrionales bacterium]
MKDIEIKIEGMSCNHCVSRVKKAIDSLKGIQNSDVSIGLAKIEFDDKIISENDIKSSIIKSGYKVI